MKKIASLLIMFLLMTSCSDNDDEIIAACSVNNPMVELAWLKTEIERRANNPNEDMKYCYIVQARYNGNDVFVYQDCNPFINKIIPIYNCEGEIINTEGNGIAFDNLTDQKIIWKTNDFVCQVNF